jgi:hypothetical protein
MGPSSVLIGIRISFADRAIIVAALLAITGTSTRTVLSWDRSTATMDSAASGEVGTFGPAEPRTIPLAGLGNCSPKARKPQRVAPRLFLFELAE